MKNIESIELSADQREKLVTARDDLQAALAIRDKAQTRVAEVRRKQESVKQEVADLGASLDGMDDAQAAKLVAKRQQIPLLERELKKSEAAVAPTEREIGHAARTAARLLHAAVKPITDEAAAEAVEAFTPFFENRDRAWRKVQESDWWKHVHAELTFLLLRVEDFHAKKIAARLDETLTGSLAWFWE